MTKRNRLKNGASQGFTLIELLVVIVILGVLGAVGYSAYINQIARANQATAQNTATALAKNCAALLITETTADAGTAFAANVADVGGDGTTITGTCTALPTDIVVTVGENGNSPATSTATVNATGSVTPGD